MGRIVLELVPALVFPMLVFTVILMITLAVIQCGITMESLPLVL